MSDCGLCSQGLPLSGGGPRNLSREATGQRRAAKTKKSHGAPKKAKQTSGKGSGKGGNKAGGNKYVDKAVKVVKDVVRKLRGGQHGPLVNGRYENDTSTTAGEHHRNAVDFGNAYGRQRHEALLPAAPALLPRREGNSGFATSEWSTAAEGVKYKLTGAPGNRLLDVRLDFGKEIVADKDALVLMDADMKFRAEVGTGSAPRAAARAAAGEARQLAYLTGNKTGVAQRVQLADPLVGDIVAIPIEAQSNAGQKTRMVVASGAFLAGTRNIKVSGQVTLQPGMKQGLPVLAVESGDDKPGLLWVNGFGAIERHDIKAGEALLVRMDHFLACKSTVKYTVNSNSALKLPVLVFEGPGTVYTHGRSLPMLLRALKA